MKELIVIWVLTLGTFSALRRFLSAPAAKLIGPRELVLAFLLPAAATFSPNYAVFALLLLTLFVILPRGNEHKVRLYFFALGLLPPLSLLVGAPAPINQLVRVDYNILLSIFCVGAAFGLAGRKSASGHPLDFLFLLLCATLIFIGTRGTSFTNFLRVILQVSLIAGLPYYIASRGLRSMERPTEIILPLLFVAVALAVVTTFESSRHWLIYENLEANIAEVSAQSAYVSQRGGFLRSGASFADPTSLSMFLALATVLLFVMRKEITSPGRIFVLACILLVGHVFTFSRIGLLVLVVGGIAALLFERRMGVAVLIALAVPASYAALTFAASHSQLVRAAFGLTDEASGTYDYRARLAERTLNVIFANPLAGISPRHIRETLPDLIQGQGIVDLVNAPLAIALQSGVPGLLFFLLPSIVALVAMWKLRREGNEEHRLLAEFLFAGLLAVNAGLLTTNYLGRNGLALYLLIGLSAGLAQRQRRPLATSNPLGLSHPATKLSVVRREAGLAAGH